MHHMIEAVTPAHPTGRVHRVHTEGPVATDAECAAQIPGYTGGIDLGMCGTDSRTPCPVCAAGT